MQSPGTFPEVVEIVVEIPRGSRNKYEFDEEVGVFRLDRVLSSAVFYNFDYGFIEGTRADDGDHTDALLVIDEPTFTGCRVWARPIGGLEMRDEKGFDFKVLCVALGDPHQQHIERLEQMRPHRLVEIQHFFDTYKVLEDKTVEVLGWRDHGRPTTGLHVHPSHAIALKPCVHTSMFSLLGFRLRQRLRRDLAEALRAKAGVFRFGSWFGVREFGEQRCS